MSNEIESQFMESYLRLALLASEGPKVVVSWNGVRVVVPQLLTLETAERYSPCGMTQRRLWVNGRDVTDEIGVWLKDGDDLCSAPAGSYIRSNG